MVGWW